VGYEPSGARRERGGAEIVDDLDATAARGPFDLLVCTEVLEHLADPTAALRTLRAKAAPGAILLVTVPHCENDYLREALAGFEAGISQPPMFNPWEHLSYFRPVDLRRLLEREGFAVMVDLGLARDAKAAMASRADSFGASLTTIARVAKRLLTGRPSTQLLCRAA
jgi:hypothetical protein